MRRGRSAAITIQCRLLCYGKTCSWTHVVWKCRLFLQFNVTYVHILSPAQRLSSHRTPPALVRGQWVLFTSIFAILLSPFSSLLLFYDIGMICRGSCYLCRKYSELKCLAKLYLSNFSNMNRAFGYCLVVASLSFSNSDWAEKIRGFTSKTICFFMG